MSEILNVPDDIPQDLLNKAECVIVLPSVLKAAFIVGGSYGRGVMTCRGGANFNGPWSSPTMMALEGGSFGLQIGGGRNDASRDSELLARAGSLCGRIARGVDTSSGQ